MNKQSMLCFVKAWRTAYETDKQLSKLGYTDTPYFNILGNIADGIYHMLGEHTQTFDESVTCAALYDENTTANQCADALIQAYEDSIPDVSDHVQSSIHEAAVNIGISNEKMICVILCEWALQRDLLTQQVRDKK